MNTCGICEKPVVQLFETGKPGVFACFKCQPLIPEVSLGQDHSEQETLDIQEDEMLIEVEVPQKDLYCGICNKTFQRNTQLQNHLRNHRAERRFVCTYCNKAFSQSNNLRAHLRIHTNERPYKCQVCDKAFTQVTNLNNHVRLHTGERPFVCPEPGCNKAYAQVTNLNQHRKRHLSGRGEESYACNICGEQFDQRNHLYTHRRELHSHSKPAPVPHVCKICDQSFRTDKQLMAHVADHMTIVADKRDDRIDLTQDEDKLPYKCVFSSCGARFSSPSEHTEHLLRAHQLRVLTVPDSVTQAPPKRGRPPKTMQSMKMDPLDPKEEITYDMQVDQLSKGQPQYIPKLRVQSLFQ